MRVGMLLTEAAVGVAGVVLFLLVAYFAKSARFLTGPAERVD